MRLDAKARSCSSFCSVPAVEVSVDRQAGWGSGADKSQVKTVTMEVHGERQKVGGQAVLRAIVAVWHLTDSKPCSRTNFTDVGTASHKRQ